MSEQLPPMGDALSNRYLAALHAIQSGIAYMINSNPSIVDPKHLRVGIDSALVNDAATARLLIAKGVFTSEEYYEELVLEAEREVKRSEAEISKLLGADIKLG